MKILVLGHARHGKDTLAEHLWEAHGLSSHSSSAFLADSFVRPHLAARGLVYDSLEACYADRVNHRELWRDLIEAFNAADPARLARAILSRADCYVGMRTVREYDASRGLFELILWVDASGRGVPPEGRGSMEIEYDPNRMLRIDNGGTIAELQAQVDDVLRASSWVRA